MNVMKTRPDHIPQKRNYIIIILKMIIRITENTVFDRKSVTLYQYNK